MMRLFLTLYFLFIKKGYSTRNLLYQNKSSLLTKKENKRRCFFCSHCYMVNQLYVHCGEFEEQRKRSFNSATFADSFLEINPVHFNGLFFFFFSFFNQFFFLKTNKSLLSPVPYFQRESFCKSWKRITQLIYIRLSVYQNQQLPTRSKRFKLTFALLKNH